MCRTVAIVVSTLLCATAAGAGSRAPQPLDQLVGRRLVVAMAGTEPSADLLNRVRRGRVGGVILFGWNITGPAQVRALTTRLQAAARAGKQHPLLIVADQEGGSIRRFRWMSPRMSAAELGLLTAREIRAIARRTGRSLRALGVNVDLAPVADVPAVRGSFVAGQRRGFASRPTLAAVAVRAFSAGLGDARVGATLKHFPGLGRATETTDVARVTITASAAQLDRELIPFAAGIRGGAELVMLSSAAYPAYGARGSAAWSPAILERLRALGFDGVTVTDALEPLARTHARSPSATALLSARAGVDLLLLAGSEASTATVYRDLVTAARAGRLSRSSLEASAKRIDELALSLAP